MGVWWEEVEEWGFLDFGEHYHSLIKEWVISRDQIEKMIFVLKRTLIDFESNDLLSLNKQMKFDLHPDYIEIRSPSHSINSEIRNSRYSKYEPLIGKTNSRVETHFVKNAASNCNKYGLLGDYITRYYDDVEVRKRRILGQRFRTSVKRVFIYETAIIQLNERIPSVTLGESLNFYLSLVPKKSDCSKVINAKNSVVYDFNIFIDYKMNSTTIEFQGETITLYWHLE